MFSRLIFSSGLVIATTISLPQIAKAESVEVLFSGAVPQQASVSTPVIDISQVEFAGAEAKNRHHINYPNTVIPLSFTVNSNITTNITVSGTNPAEFLKYNSNSSLIANFSETSANLSPGTNNLKIDISLPITEKNSNNPLNRKDDTVIFNVTP